VKKYPTAGNGKIHRFAQKWSDLYGSLQTSDYRLADSSFADECWQMGFEMDCGESFSKKYPKAFESYDELNKIINDITDVYELGTAIFSHWRYITHWSYTLSFTPEDRLWFLRAFDRLVELTEDANHKEIFTPQKIELLSDVYSYGPCPDKDDIVEQKITLYSDGRVWVTYYKFGDGRNYQADKKERFTVNPSDAKIIVDKIYKYFEDDYVVCFATDVGSWDLKIVADNGSDRNYRGSIIWSNSPEELKRFSREIRRLCNHPDLILFDGFANDVFLERFSMGYFRENDVESYNESLVINRESGMIFFAKKKGKTCLEQIYTDKEKVPDLLDSIYTDDFWELESDEMVEDDKLPQYSLTIKCKNSDEEEYQGHFCKDNLPKTYENIVAQVSKLFEGLATTEIFDKKVYNRKANAPQYAYCSVAFNQSEKTYYYIADEEYSVNDLVFVPTGSENKKTIATIVEIEYFDEDNVPLPVEKTKHIISKVGSLADDYPPKEVHCPVLNRKCTDTECIEITAVAFKEMKSSGLSWIKDLEWDDSMRDICLRCKYNPENYNKTGVILEDLLSELDKCWEKYGEEMVYDFSDGRDCVNTILTYLLTLDENKVISIFKNLSDKQLDRLYWIAEELIERFPYMGNALVELCKEKDIPLLEGELEVLGLI